MEEQNNDNALPFTTLAFGGSFSNAFYAEEADQNHCFHWAAASIETPHVPTTLRPWIYCQQAPSNYVEFHAESGISEFQKELPFRNYPGSSGFISHEASHDMVGHKRQRPGNEGALLNDFTGSEYQIPPSQNSNGGCSPAASGFPSTVPSSRSKQKVANADRRRRLRISEGLEALQDLLPHSKEGAKASALNDAIDHIKYLQFQIKGYGRYLLHDQMRNEHLEEMMGKLLEVNPLAATQLLETRGIFMTPVALAEGLRPQV